MVVDSFKKKAEVQIQTENVPQPGTMKLNVFLKYCDSSCVNPFTLFKSVQANFAYSFWQL